MLYFCKHIFFKNFGIFPILAICLLLINACNQPQEKGYHFKLECDGSHDLPQVKNFSHTHEISDQDSISIELGGKISKKEFHSAPSSIQLKTKNSYTFITTINPIGLNEFFRVSVWRKDKSKKGQLIVRGEPSSVFYKGKAKCGRKRRKRMGKVRTRI